MENVQAFLKEKLSTEAFDKLTALNTPAMHEFVAKAIELTSPDSVFVCTDSAEDLAYIRSQATELGEEHKLEMEGHTYHFDGYNDQARDPARTKYLLPKGVSLGERLKSTDRDEALDELNGIFKDSYKGKQMLVCFWCLCPADSEFAISCVQVTDSAYVAHSESILYRAGYEQFKKVDSGGEFFKFLHTAGELEGGVSKNVDKRRIYMDLMDNAVYSTNTQYAGNTVGLKKLALRLAINKAAKEGWLAEHMFIMGANGPNNRITYFAGAFPSACGKTSTAMLPGQTIIGDDIAYFRKIDGEFRAANVECGIFGIIRDVNPHDDPVIYKALTNPGEVIFGNVLINDNKPYWMGMGQDIPRDGTNYAGAYTEGMKGPDGKEVTPSHKNARYTIRISALENKDKLADDPKGVPLGGIIYGGRDSDTLVPVEQAFNWTEGIITKGAAIESETTAATIGQEGVRKFNMMANMDFVSIPLGQYIQNNLDFVKGIANEPLIFSVNYFLRDENGKYLNGMLDKKVWLLWAELRAHNDAKALVTPTGLIPLYEDVAKLFKNYMDAGENEYTKEQYEQQFTIRIPKLFEKFDRIEQVYRGIEDTPKLVFDTFDEVRGRLDALKAKKGEMVSPFELDAE